MRITADTNVLVRAIVGDDPAQAAAAQQALTAAEAIALPLPMLCELVWVLRMAYRVPTAAIIETLRGLTGNAKCWVDRPAVEAGIAALEAGGDFADGVVAHEGRGLGGANFMSFDKNAVAILSRMGVDARLLG